VQAIPASFGRLDVDQERLEFRDLDVGITYEARERERHEMLGADGGTLTVSNTIFSLA
jgi:hypothetical protein